MHVFAALTSFVCLTRNSCPCNPTLGQTPCRHQSCAVDTSPLRFWERMMGTARNFLRVVHRIPFGKKRNGSVRQYSNSHLRYPEKQLPGALLSIDGLYSPSLVLLTPLSPHVPRSRRRPASNSKWSTSHALFRSTHAWYDLDTFTSTQYIITTKTLWMLLFRTKIS